MTSARAGYLTTEQVRERYGYYKLYLYRKRDQGLLKAYRFTDSRLTYWKQSELDRLSDTEVNPPVEKWRREVVDENPSS